MISRRRVLSLAALPLLARAQAGSRVPVEALRFSSLAPEAALPAWLERITFRGRPQHTEYTLVADEGHTVLRARARASTSGLARELKVDPSTHPLVTWRW